MRKTCFLCLVSAVIGAMVALYLTGPCGLERTSIAQEATGPQIQPAPTSGGTAQPAVDEDLTPEERVNVAVYETSNRSVAKIATELRSGGLLFEVTSTGEGSGVVISREGHILTNYHVVEGAQHIEVNLWDGKPYTARLVGQDPTVDVAVIKIDAPADVLFPLTFGDSTRLRVGQKVYAIGNPFGFERTLSTGIISSLNRDFPNRRGFRHLKQIIQIDAAINPGNSGGPLLDSHGRMIGMNTAIASKTGESAGVGFAIPINTIARVVPQLIKNGRVIRPDVGIASVAQMENGLRILTLVPHGPAEQAGLRGVRVSVQRKRFGPTVYEYRSVDRAAGDLIVAVDGQPVRTADDFLSLVETKQPGNQVVIGVIRDGRPVNVPVRLGVGEE